MDIVPFKSAHLPRGCFLKDVIAVCFHPVLSSVYVALKNAVQEYDVITGSEIGEFPLAMPPVDMVVLGERNALVVCQTGGGVVVIDVVDGHILAEHAPRADKGDKAFQCTSISTATAFPQLIFSWTKSPIVHSMNLFTVNKKLPSFTGHKTPICCLAAHPTLPLVACSAIDGTVRIFELTSKGLYNVIECEMDKDSVRKYTKLQFHSSGSASAVKGKKQRKKGMSFYKDVRLLLVAEKSLIVYYDVSIPGAPNKLRDYFSPGSAYRDAHFLPGNPDVIFYLDHKGLYRALHADGCGELEGSNTAGVSLQPKEKKKHKEFKPNSCAFSLLSEYENVAPFAVPVRSRKRHGVPPQCLGGKNLLSVAFSPSYPFHIFYGTDYGKMDSLAYFTIYRLQKTTRTYPGAGIPLVTPLRTPLRYWLSPHERTVLDGVVYSLSGKGNNTVIVRSHELDTGCVEDVHAFVPKVGEGKTMEHCIPVAIERTGEKSFTISVRYNGRDGQGEIYTGEPGGVFAKVEKRVLEGTEVVVCKKFSEEWDVGQCGDAGGKVFLRLVRGEEFGGRKVWLDPEECILEAVGMDGGELVGIATTNRVIIADKDLGVKACHNVSERPHSLHWVGGGLVFVEGCKVMGLAGGGGVFRVASLPARSAVVGSLYDRFIVATIQGMSVVVWSKFASHFETLCRGALTLPSPRPSLKTLTSSYNTHHTTQPLLHTLTAANFTDLATHLSDASSTPHPNPYIECSLNSTSVIQGSTWHAKTLLHTLSGNLPAALRDIKSALERLRRDAMTIIHQDSIPKTTPPAPFVETGMLLFQAAVHRGDDATAVEILKVIKSPFEVLAFLRKERDVKGLRKLAEVETGVVAKLAGMLAEKVEGEGGGMVNTVPALASKENWVVGSTVDGVSVMLVNGEEKELERLDASNINSYLWAPEPFGVSPDDDHAGSGFGHHSSDEDDGDLEEEFHASPHPDDDVKSNAGDEDEIARQQEELRRQYLSSFAGQDADDDGEDDGEPGFATHRKFKKFTINKEAVFKQPTLSSLQLGFNIPSAAAPSTSRQAPPGVTSTDSDHSPSQSPPPENAAPPPPSFLGTSASDCLRNALAKLERSRYPDALKRLDAARYYLKSDATVVAKKTPLIQVAHYIVCCNMLSEVKQLEKDGFEDDVAKVAVLMFLLTRLNLQKKQAGAYMKLAIKYNIDAKNYGLASHLISASEEPSAYEPEGEKCTANENSDANPDAATLLTATDQSFCWKTFVLLTETKVKCTYCPAVLREGTPGTECEFCSYGVTE